MKKQKSMKAVAKAGGAPKGKPVMKADDPKGRKNPGNRNYGKKC